jgi:hypothetical protein
MRLILIALLLAINATAADTQFFFYVQDCGW